MACPRSRPSLVTGAPPRPVACACAGADVLSGAEWRGNDGERRVWALVATCAGVCSSTGGQEERAGACA